MLTKIVRMAAVAACVLVASNGNSQAQELQPGSLHWPLWKLDNSDPQNPVWPEPRLGVTNSQGNFQGDDYNAAYLSSPVDQRSTYLHPGVDIRGQNFDVVEAPETGDVWLSNADTDFCPHGNGANTQCRIYLLDPQKRYVYYFSHIDYAAASGPNADSIRVAIENARAQQDAYDGSMAPADLVETANDTRVNRGQFIGVLADFPSYHHTHFGIFDLQSNFDMLYPLNYLEHRPAAGFDYIDTDVPVVHDLYLEQEASIAGQGTRVTLAGDCPQLTGGKYDIIANMEDSLNSANGIQTGEYAMLSSVHRARMILQRAHGARDERQWYDFDHLPLQCAGNWKAGACNGTASWQTFFDVIRFSKAALADAVTRPGVLGADAGALIRDKLFAFGTTWFTSSPSTYLQVLTHSWGQDGNWDADAAPDGLYYLTGEAEDASGNKAARSLKFLLNKSGSPLGADVAGDVMVRDRPDDSGATPSSAGGQPFWISPDIIIRSWDNRDSVINATDIEAINPSEPKVVAGEKYALFVRVRNAGCAPVSGLSAALYAAEPAPVPGNWQQRSLGSLTTSVTLGPNAPDSQVLLIGPFEYTPAAEEAGHRCLLAAVNSVVDPVGPDVTDAASDNNVAQRNVQINGPFTWGLNNPTPASARVVLRFTADQLPLSVNNPELWIQNDPALAAWVNAPGTTTRVEGNQLVVHFNSSPISLPEVTLPAATGIPAEFRATSPSNGVHYIFHFEQSLDGMPRGGVTFQVYNGIIT